ncbi:hypothetical protein C8R43DRAFT_1117019 [Mycena crocata]|nr:hypothetical protein C8R43DRAFT_1117019 [Mycena crocata]
MAAAPAGFAGPFAKMISPTYALKIVHKDFSVSPSNRIQVEAYRLEAQHMIRVKYWIKNNQRAFTFDVPVTNFPWFHPKDSDTITGKIKQTTLEEDDEWVVTSTATRVKPNTTLYMRSPDVDTCLGLRPDPMVHKHQLSESQETPASPASSTPSPSKRSRSNRQPIFVLDNDSDENGNSDFDLLPSSPSPSPSNTLASGHSPSHQALIGSLPEPLNPSASPRGKPAPFPLAYACDMDAAFRQIKNHPNFDDLSARQRFDTVFEMLDIQFKSSTWSDSWNAWDILSAHAGVALQKGKGPGNINSLCAAIEKAEVAVDWGLVLGKAADATDGSAVDLLFRQYFADKLIVKPIGIESPLSSVPSSPDTKAMDLDSSHLRHEAGVNPKGDGMDVDQNLSNKDLHPKARLADKKTTPPADPLNGAGPKSKGDNMDVDPNLANKKHHRSIDPKGASMDVDQNLTNKEDRPQTPPTSNMNPKSDLMDLDQNLTDKDHLVTAPPPRKEPIPPADLLNGISFQGGGIDPSKNLTNKDYRPETPPATNEHKLEFRPEIGGGQVFYTALDSNTRDEDWTPMIIIKDCTRDPHNVESHFAAGIDRDVRAYGPKDTADW